MTDALKGVRSAGSIRTEVLTQHKKRAKKDEDFKNLWEDEDFKKLVE